MTKLSVCVEMFWEGVAVEKNISRVAELGFDAFEFWGWTGKNLDNIRAAQEKSGLTLAAFCCETEATLTNHTRESQLTDGMRKSAQVAHSLNCSRLIVTTGNEVPGQTFKATMKKVVSGLKLMARVAQEENITLVLEPLNTIVDHRGYWLSRMSDAVSIVEEVGSPRLKILYDIYHQQITEGNLLSNITQHIAHIGHFHAAGVPGRHELVGGELDYGSIFSGIRKSGYDGYIGMEFSPTKPGTKSLKEAVELAK